jgi:hypothetical protein
MLMTKLGRDHVEYRKTVHDHKRLNPDFSL